MNASARRAAICDLLRTRPVGVDELAVRFGVTASTIRRDLAVLTESGAIVRTYGGALAAGAEEQPLHERETMAALEKAAIARAAEEYVRPGQLLFFDAGTTVGALAARLAAHAGTRSGLTVATTGLTTLNALADAEGVDLIALGGVVRHISHGMVGPITELALAGLTADAVFMSADGVTADRGLCEASAEQAAVKRLMIERAAEVFVLADASKLGRAGSHWWTSLPPAWTLITDASATPEQLAPFRQLAEVTVVVAET